MDLDQAAAELYALTPAEFTGRRAELVAAARAAGDREAGRAIAAQRRPTVAAWLVNLLVRDQQPGRSGSDGGSRDQGDRLADLLRLGVDLRAAQAALDGARIRELSRQRPALLGALVQRARELAGPAGQQVGAGVQRELEETLAAAVADDRAAQAVSSGLLTRALAYAGIGQVDLDAATAVVRTRATGRPAPRADRSLRAVSAPDSDARDRHAVDAARSAVALAEQALARSRERHQRATAAEQDLTSTVDRLQSELARARRDLMAASHAVTSADRDLARRERAAADAGQALARAEQHAD